MSAPDSPLAPQSGILSALGWACYLGISWTWVIGMFFPVLFFAQWGWCGWLVFALPNVVGAAAMGWVVSEPDKSRRIVERHEAACRAFTYVTLSFHVFATGWIVAFVLGPWAAGLAMAGAGCLWSLLQAGHKLATPVAVGITAISIVLFAAALGLVDVWPNPASPALRVFPVKLPGLVWFIPASITGFALCPYLDLTFHRARQATQPATGRAAFALGFGVVFLFMILFSAAYAGVLNPLIWSNADSFPLADGWRIILAIYFILQIGFTVGIHLHAVTASPADPMKAKRVPVLMPLALAVLIGGGLGAIAYLEQDDHVLGPALGELIYRCFLLFYGVVFPGYVWLCMIPTWGESRLRLPVNPTKKMTPPSFSGRRAASHAGRCASPAKRKRKIWAIAVIIALPMAYAGFVMGRSWWMLGSLGVLIAARVIVEAMGFRSGARQVAALNKT